MTREEAIKVLKENYDYHVNYDSGDYNEWGDDLVEAVKMAIHALEQEPCEYTVSLAELLNHVEDLGTARGVKEGFIIRMPSVKPKVKTGHWIDDCGNLKCPYCETRVSDVKVFSPLTKYTNACWFCPICGADMKEGEE